ncbi:hypothetical protein EVAR_25572_1 [Eumeta japonica]|uniref:Uncharacterized protein n=1 Tax=Eumeta variegata TaxID=151549 RepID=A0A4C1V0M7_EUMVA|nr:hypothetical protein EVAR_25572_1 [Eumeta japonica]
MERLAPYTCRPAEAASPKTHRCACSGAAWSSPAPPPPRPRRRRTGSSSWSRHSRRPLHTRDSERQSDRRNTSSVKRAPDPTERGPRAGRAAGSAHGAIAVTITCACPRRASFSS